jgi:signal transduction histidine kinase
VIGWIGTFAYGSTAGAYAAFAFVLMLLATRLRQDRVVLPMALFAVAASANVVVTLAMQKADTVDDYAALLKLFGLAGLAVLVTIVTVLDRWTGEVRRWERLAFFVGAGVVAVFQVALENGLLAGEVTGLRTVTLFGEDFVVHEGDTSPWRPVLDVFLVGTAAVIVAALYRRARSGSRYGILGVVCGLLVFVGFNGYDSLVDAGEVDTPYLMPFGVLVLLVWVSFHVADLLATTQATLAAQAVQLEETVAERTAALLDANEEIRSQLVRQRENAALLVALADRFETVNLDALVLEDHEGLACELGDVLHAVADLLRADAVTLQLDQGLASSRFPTVLTVPDGAGSLVEPGAPAAVAPVRIGTRAVGAVSVYRDEMPAVPMTDEAIGHLELACELLAGVVHRVQMADDLQAAAVDVERQRIARELHDSVTQRLYSASFLADAAARLVDTDPEETAGAVRRIRTLILVSLAELRVLLFELQPASLGTEPIGELIDQLAEMVNASADVSVETRIGHHLDVPHDVKTVFYRIAQEAMSNAARHSGASSIRVSLEHDGDRSTMVVEDDGCGFDVDTAHRGHGLRNVVDRAEEIGAEIHLDSAPGRGTRVAVSWIEDVSALDRAGGVA